MTDKKIILIGGSAGSFSSILKIIYSIPKYFKTPIVVILHRNPRFNSQIELLLNQNAQVRVKSILDKENILNNTIYFAPAGYHLLIEPDYTFSLDISETIQFSRPSIDVTFESAAEIYRKNCYAILLSGANHDGATGMQEVQQYGGFTYVQNPEEAAMSTMPEAAIALNKHVKICTLEEIMKIILQIDAENNNS